MLNVAIDIDPSEMGRVADGANACDHVTGTIRYPDGTEGRLVYGKALVTATAPWDVRAYATKDDRFPVHPTTDQLFGGETFDAYQSLGRCVGARCGGGDGHHCVGLAPTRRRPASPTSASRDMAATSDPAWAIAGRDRGDHSLGASGRAAP